MTIEQALKPVTPLHEILNEVSKNTSNICANFPNGKNFAIWKEKGFWWHDVDSDYPNKSGYAYEIYAKNTEECIQRIQKEYYEQ